MAIAAGELKSEGFEQPVVGEQGSPPCSHLHSKTNFRHIENLLLQQQQSTASTRVDKQCLSGDLGRLKRPVWSEKRQPQLFDAAVNQKAELAEPKEVTRHSDQADPYQLSTSR